MLRGLVTVVTNELVSEQCSPYLVVISPTGELLEKLSLLQTSVTCIFRSPKLLVHQNTSSGIAKFCLGFKPGSQFYRAYFLELQNLFQRITSFECKIVDETGNATTVLPSSRTITALCEDNCDELVTGVLALRT